MTSPDDSSATSQSNECSSARCRVNQLDIRDTAENGTLLLAAESASSAAEAAARSFGEELLLSDTEQLVGVGPVFWTIVLRVGMFLLMKLVAAWLKDHNSYGWIYEWLSKYLTWRNWSDRKPGRWRIFPWRRRK